MTLLLFLVGCANTAVTVTWEDTEILLDHALVASHADTVHLVLTDADDLDCDVARGCEDADDACLSWLPDHLALGPVALLTVDWTGDADQAATAGFEWFLGDLDLAGWWIGEGEGDVDAWGPFLGRAKGSLELSLDLSFYDAQTASEPAAATVSGHFAAGVCTTGDGG